MKQDGPYRFWWKLDEYLPKESGGKVVLLFDEAHCLLHPNGYWLRCLQTWLTVIRPYHVVAVLAGVTPELALSYHEFEQQLPTQSLRTNVHPIGKEFYAPFTTLSTIGCVKLSRHLDTSTSTTTTTTTTRRSDEADPVKEEEESSSSSSSEYHESIQYGRPLFSVMYNHQKLNDVAHSAILHKILLGCIHDYHEDYDSGHQACLNVLAWRVQRGQTSFEVVEKLVAKGYANLTYCVPSHKMARMCHFPDPVCARLAMCLIDETWTASFDHDTIRGQAKQFWSQ